MGDGEAEAAAAELAAEMERLRADGIETAHVGIFDLNGTFRERRLSLDDVTEVFGQGGTER